MILPVFLVTLSKHFTVLTKNQLLITFIDFERQQEMLVIDKSFKMGLKKFVSRRRNKSLNCIEF